MTELTQLLERPGPSSTKAKAAPRQVLVITCAGVVLASLDLFIVNVALPQIARDLKASNLGELSWVLNGYAIVYASLLVFFGRLADRYRRDRAFLLGVAVFTAASAACAASTSVGMLIGFRLVQAAGAALLTPTSLGLVLASYPPERRHGAVRAWTAVGGMSAAVGPVVGGLLVAASWRWVFLVNVPVGIAALIVGWRRLPHVPGHPSERPNALGVVLATAGVAALTFGLVKGSDWGWGSPAIAWTLAASAVAHRALRAPLPSEPHSAHPSVAVSLPELHRGVAGRHLLLRILRSDASLDRSLGAGRLGMVGAAIRAGHRTRTDHGPRSCRSSWPAGSSPATAQPRAMALGSLVFGAGVSWWALAITVQPNYLSGVLGGMILTGVGVGLTLPTMMATAASSLPPQSFATGSAVINMIRQTGLALGVAVLVAVLGTAAGHDSAALDAFRHGWWVSAAISFVGIVPALSLLRRPAPAIATT